MNLKKLKVVNTHIMYPIKVSELISKPDAIYDGYSLASANYSPKRVSPETLLSPLEERILRSDVPIAVDDDEEITALAYTGIHANRLETVNWKGFRYFYLIVFNYFESNHTNSC